MVKRSVKTAVRGEKPQVDEILEVLREKIANHDLPPGCKLRESALSEEFGVSRARIREVFGVIEERSLIERIPNRGVVVTRLTPAQAFDLFDVREVLEGLAIRLATQNMPPETWQDLVEMFGEPAEKGVREGDFEGYMEKLAILRHRITNGADNPLLASQLDRLDDQTRVLVKRLVILPGRAAEGLVEHRQILAAMRHGDAEEAERLKRENIRGARECFRRYQKLIL